jgi:hypothetical protein
MEPKPPSAPSNNISGSTGQPQHQAQPPGVNSGGQQAQQQPEKKKGFWGRLFGSGNDKKDDNKDNKPAANGPGNRPPQ